LIELLVVISIIAVLAGLAFPAFQSVQNSAKKAQAKNDVTQLVTAVNAYYTEYGRYPLPAAIQGQNQDYTFGSGGASSNGDLMKILQNDSSASADNPRGIVFYNGLQAKSPGGYGIQSGSGSPPYEFNDPWSRSYTIRIDSDYDGKVQEPGTGALITNGLIAWSLGKDNDWVKSGISSWK